MKVSVRRFQCRHENGCLATEESRRAVQRAQASPTSWCILCTHTNNFSFSHLLNDHIVSNLLDNNEKTKMPLTINFVFFLLLILIQSFTCFRKRKKTKKPEALTCQFFLRVIKNSHCAEKNKKTNLTPVNLIISNKPHEKLFCPFIQLVSWRIKTSLHYNNLQYNKSWSKVFYKGPLVFLIILSPS